MAATREDEYSALAPGLYLAFELGNDFWKLGFTVGMGQQPRERNIAARDLDGLQREIRLAKKRFGLPGTAPGLRCYEGGRGGVWVSRYVVGAPSAREGGHRHGHRVFATVKKARPRQTRETTKFMAIEKVSLPVKADF